MDLDITMMFSAGSIFIFGSWVCLADDSGKLQGHLVEISADQATSAVRQAGTAGHCGQAECCYLAAS
jgi:hypothetical protein